MVQLTLIKLEEDLFKVKVYDREGNRLFVKRIKRNNKSKISFDISQFPEGDYEFVIERNREKLHSMKVEKK